MTQRIFRNALPLLSLAAGLAVQARGANIVSDGGFETPTPSGIVPYTGSLGDGWSATAGTIAIFSNADGEGGVAHSGNQFAYLDWAETVNTVSQTLTTVVGQSYTISFWLADTNANAVTVTFGGQTLFNGSAPTNGVGSSSNYVNYTYTVTATYTSTVLAFTGQYTEGGYGTILDDVSVTLGGAPPPTPAPRSLYLCLIGLAGLALYAAFQVRRRQVV
jgi:hypothetical protein